MWVTIDKDDESTWPPAGVYTLNWNVDQWFVENPGELRTCIEESPESMHGVKYLVLPKVD